MAHPTSASLPLPSANSFGRIERNIVCIVEGRGRVLHDPGLRRPVTLAYSQPGDLVGWAVWYDVIHVSGSLQQLLKLIGFPLRISIPLSQNPKHFLNGLTQQPLRVNGRS